MIEWAVVIGLIFLGCFLIWAEIVFVPGIFITALIGIICAITGVYKSYGYFGSTTGNLVLAGTIVINVINLVFIFRGRSWDKFSLKETNTSRVNDKVEMDLKSGDVGKSISSLKPVGKAEFGSSQFEVSSMSGYVEENVEIEVVRIESNKIIVKKK